MACGLSCGASAATGGCLLTRYLVEGPACDGSRKREWALGGLDGCDKDKMCLVSTCEQDEDSSRERVTSSLSLWPQERVKAEELMEQKAVEQDRPDGERHGADHSGRSSSKLPNPSGGARPTSRRHNPGSDKVQQPKELRARDEF